MAKKKRSSKINQSPSPQPKNESQKQLINSLQTYPMTIAEGPAGVGKSYIGASYAAHLYLEGRITNIVLTRPTVPTGRSIGFFPGSLMEKMDPWTKPIMNTLKEHLGEDQMECMVKNGKLEIVPFETIRGRSFKDTFVILDEAQNCTKEEIKAFVTRVGEHSIVFINGDCTQSDINGDSGLASVVEMVKNSPDLQRYVGLINFTSDDVVRSGLCQLWVREYESLENRCMREVPAFLRNQKSV